MNFLRGPTSSLPVPLCSVCPPWHFLESPCLSPSACPGRPAPCRFCLVFCGSVTDCPNRGLAGDHPGRSVPSCPCFWFFCVILKLRSMERCKQAVSRPPEESLMHLPRALFWKVSTLNSFGCPCLSLTWLLAALMAGLGGCSEHCSGELAGPLPAEPLTVHW